MLRHAAVEIAEGKAAKVEIGPAQVAEILGQPRFENEVAMRTASPGVATGLAWTPVGGDILFIEAARTPGGGRLILTGQLGDVMKESAQAALSLVKGHAAELGVDPALFEKSDIHVHVPAGATPRTTLGGVPCTWRYLADTRAANPLRTAMTGEISLRGPVLPAAGSREKVVAPRAGLTWASLPACNRRVTTRSPATPATGWSSSGWKRSRTRGGGSGGRKGGRSGLA